MNDLQRTPEWRTARLGCLTGSRIADATAKLKSGNGWGATRANYLAELLTERLTGQPAPNYVSKAMQDGIDREPDAMTVYEFERNVTVEPVGFILHPRIAMAGCSPDGFIGDDGTISIKCPIPATHIDTMFGASIDGGYIKQLQWELACTGRKWCDFVSYCPLFPPDLQMEIRRVLRDDIKIAELEKQGEEFLRELAEKQARLFAIRADRDDTTLRQLQASVEALGA